MPLRGRVGRQCAMAAVPKDDDCFTLR